MDAYSGVFLFRIQRNEAWYLQQRACLPRNGADTAQDIRRSVASLQSNLIYYSYAWSDNEGILTTYQQWLSAHNRIVNLHSPSSEMSEIMLFVVPQEDTVVLIGLGYYIAIGAHTRQPIPHRDAGRRVV